MDKKKNTLHTLCYFLHLSNKGFSILEVILASSLFVIFSSGIVGLMIQGYQSNRQSKEYAVATEYATEGIEAVRSIKNQGYTTLTTVSSADRGVTGPVWAFLGDGTNNTYVSGKTYTRTVKIEAVQRDCTGSVVVSGGIADPNTKKITSRVSWSAAPNRTEDVIFTSYLSDWKKPLPTNKGGMLVYGDSVPAADAIKYKILDGDTGVWSAEAQAGDVDASTNRVLRAARLFASATRNEKVLVSRHYNGTTQYIYAQVFNGLSWCSVQLLSSWNSTNFLDVRNFDGTYLSDGSFLVVYSDNTTTPKYRVWDGTSWSAQTNTTDVGGIPNYIVAKARPGTNEAMLAVFDQNNTPDTNTTYFNGTSWSAAIEHATNAPFNTKELIDFTWSVQNTLKGQLVYSDAASGTNSRAIVTKTFTANGSGGGSWSALARSALSTSTVGAMDIDSRKGAEEFLSCQKDGQASPDIFCFRANTTPTWTTPTNNNLTGSGSSDTGIQRSFDLAYEATTGTQGITVYSDTTAIPKLKKYNATTNTFDAAATNLSSVAVALETVRLKALANNDDIMILLANTNNDLFSVVWNGSADAVYTTPAGKAFSAHGINGSSDEDFWYDFAWDRY